MYSTGRGVPQDNIEAHMWLNLAASRSSGADRERSVGVRDRVAERMTPADLSEGTAPRAGVARGAPGSLTACSTPP